MNKNILWLPSWYPNILSPWDGDFIQRHARAVALFEKITVIYVKKDEKGIITKDEMIVSSIKENVNETIAFYHVKKTGIHFLDRFLSSIKYRKLYRKALTDFIKESGKPDLVHVHVATKAGIQACWLKKKFGIPFIVSEHWTGHLSDAKFGLKDLNVFQLKSIQKVFSESQKITVVSKALGEAISENFSIPGFSIIPNVVDTAIFLPKINFSNTPARFIHISSLNYQKNIEGIIKAFQMIKEMGYEFRLLIFGPFKNEHIQLVKDHNLAEFIEFKNEVPQYQLAPYLSASDALVLYSFYETFGCVVIEANACGIPAILSDLPVFREYITESENGIFAAPDNPGKLARVLENFILGKYHFDKQMIAEKTAGKFNYHVIGKQFVSVYENLLNNR